MISNVMFEYLLNQVSFGIYILDCRQRYIYANDAYLDLLSLSREQIMLKSVHELQRQKLYDLCVSDYVFHEKQKCAFFLNVFVDNGITIKKSRVLVRAIPLFAEGGEISYMVGICDSVDALNECYCEAETRSLADPTFASAVLKQDAAPPDIIASSSVMQQVLKVAGDISKVDSTVLITGASGTGKELMAEYIHRNSPRSGRRMVVVNCASIPESLMESTLYGYEKGSFTGALTSGKEGLIEAADGSTLFLDEINSMPLNLQGKLLRTLENKKIQRVGSVKEHDVDFRLVAATNSDLREMVQTGRFRKDLFYRLNILPIHLPSLKERKEDILPLARFFLQQFSERYKKEMILSELALQVLQRYEWPGNIRELRNVMERVVVMTGKGYVDDGDMQKILEVSDNLGILFPQNNAALSDEKDYFETLLENHVLLQSYTDSCEKAYLQYALSKFGSTYKAAEALGTSQSLIMRRKNKHGL